MTLDELLMLAAAVRRGLSTPLLVGDLPFGSYEVSNEDAIRTAQRFIKEVGCDAVKVERGGTTVDRVRAIVGAGIPVMGHVGLTPQTATALGGYRSQGRTAERGLEVMHDAIALQEAGCFAVVFEAIPSDLTELIMPRMQIPVIGIGAGPAADGQVLVFHDLLGIYDGHAARFVKRYADVREQMVKGVSAFAADVRERRYPEPDHGYTMAPGRGRAAARSARRADRGAVHGRLQPLASRRRSSSAVSTERPRRRRRHHRERGQACVIVGGVANGVVSTFVPGLDRGRHGHGVRAGGVARPARRPGSDCVPPRGRYEHNRLNADTELATPHIRAAIVGPVGRPSSGSRREARRRHLQTADARRVRRSPAQRVVLVPSWAESPSFQGRLGLAWLAQLELWRSQ